MPRSRFTSTQRLAISLLLDYGLHPDPDLADARQVRTLASIQQSRELAPGAFDLEETVWLHFGVAIEAEGSAAFAGMDKPGWARDIIRKAQLFRNLTDHYDAFIFENAAPDPVGELRRDTAQWNEILRRNVTLPRGLVYEIEAVRRRLAESDPPRKISFSGLLESAVRELLARPSDKDDARFYDAELQDYWYYPEQDERTISDIIAEHGIGARRPSVAVTDEATSS